MADVLRVCVSWRENWKSEQEERINKIKSTIEPHNLDIEYNWEKLLYYLTLFLYYIICDIIQKTSNELGPHRDHTVPKVTISRSILKLG